MSGNTAHVFIAHQEIAARLKEMFCDWRCFAVSAKLKTRHSRHRTGSFYKHGGPTGSTNMAALRAMFVEPGIPDHSEARRVAIFVAWRIKPTIGP